MKKPLGPVKAIRAYCLDCSEHSPKEVVRCELEDCPLWPYRMGKNPSRAGKGGRTAIELEKIRKKRHSTKIPKAQEPAKKDPLAEKSANFIYPIKERRDDANTKT